MDAVRTRASANRTRPVARMLYRPPGTALRLDPHFRQLPPWTWRAVTRVSKVFGHCAIPERSLTDLFPDGDLRHRKHTTSHRDPHGSRARSSTRRTGSLRQCTTHLTLPCSGAGLAVVQVRWVAINGIGQWNRPMESANGVSQWSQEVSLNISRTPVRAGGARPASIEATTSRLSHTLAAV